MPYLTLIFVASLSGAFMGLVLFFLQVPFIAVLLMNAQTRDIYEIGINTIVERRDSEARESQAQSAPAPIMKKKKTSK
jgi:mannose/fructose/N-acetylgalactosamine-specific phosphotransferase system component IID